MYNCNQFLIFPVTSILVISILTTKHYDDHSLDNRYKLNPFLASLACVLDCFQCLLIHWGRVTHICVSKLTIIGSDNGLSPGRRQAIIWTNAGLLLIEPLGTNFSEISIGIQRFSFKEMHLNMSSAKWRPFCLGLNELTVISQTAWLTAWLTARSRT